MALKTYYMSREAQRASASLEHRERAAARVAVLEEQRSDLLYCLQILLCETVVDRRSFKIYRQFKMYNDPELNPRIYQAHANAEKAPS